MLPTINIQTARYCRTSLGFLEVPFNAIKLSPNFVILNLIQNLHLFTITLLLFALFDAVDPGSSPG